jgi:very-short-patch-repair endonuclease
MSQRVSPQHRGQARRLRRDSTDAESVLWRLLRSRRLAHVKFRRQVPIGPWIVDFVSFEQKIVVEADGGQHGSERDARRDDDLTSRGFHVLRDWNNDILSNSTGVLEHLLSCLADPPHPAASGRHPLPQGERGRPSKIKG